LANNFIRSKSVLEKRIENVLRVSPELIDPRFRGKAVETQQTRGQSRLDLMIQMPRGVIIVEIKKVVLSPKDVLQVLAYCRKWALHHSQRVLHETYLIGYAPLEEQPLRIVAARSVYRLHLRYLGKHVPKVVQEKSSGGYEPWDGESGQKHLRIAA
jgi:hypothetical protein